MTFSPVISSPTLPKDKVVRPEDLAVGAAPDGVHGARLEVDEDGPGDVLASRGLVVVHIDPLQLKVRGAGIASRGVDSMFVANDLPELKEIMRKLSTVCETVSYSHLLIPAHLSI